MSQNVERLKQLLFESETVALSELSERIARLTASEARAREELTRRLDGVAASDAHSASELRSRIAELAEAGNSARSEFQRHIDNIAAIDAKARSELTARLDNLHDRAGDDERLTASVAQIISDALRRAEVSHHIELSEAIAPLIVSTIKTELRNSQDEMVEALYPITGRLVKAYVASAITDLTEEMNRRLEQNAVMLRLQSLATGRPVAELALSSANDFALKELYLIRRSTGELVAHWPLRPVSGREHVMSGVLAAVNEFANEALSADQSSLREIDIGGEQVYLRGSPVYLLAARCSGQAPTPIAQALDDAFLSAVERQHSIDSNAQFGVDTTSERSAALAKVGEDLSTTVSDKLESRRQSSSMGPLKLLAAIILVPVLGWFGWSLYTDYRVAQVRSTAARIIAADPAMTGYPVEISVGGHGRELMIMGLAPSNDARLRIIHDLNQALPRVALHERINLVAGSDLKIPDIAPELSLIRQDLSTAVAEVRRTARQQSNSRAATRLSQAAADIGDALPAVTDAGAKADLQKIAAGIAAIRSDFEPLSVTVFQGVSEEMIANSAVAYQKLTDRLNGLSNALLAVTGVPAAQDSKRNEHLSGLSLDAAIDSFANASDRIAGLASTAAAAKSLTPPPPQVTEIIKETPPQTTPRQALRDLARDHAVFFGDDLSYRQNEDADRLLDQIADLMKQNPGQLRVIGYTDDTGIPDKNRTLAYDRANKVLEDLVARGVGRGDMIAVGRSGTRDLSDEHGSLSANRRVEFELAFEGEFQR